MKFGFDIDDTLINLREFAFHLYNEKLNTNIELTKFRALKTLEIHEAFRLDKEAGGKMWNSPADEVYYSSCPAFEGEVETLQELESRWSQKSITSPARKAEHGERTKKWLIENGFPVKDDHFYCGMKGSMKKLIRSANWNWIIILMINRQCWKRYWIFQRKCMQWITPITGNWIFRDRQAGLN